MSVKHLYRYIDEFSAHHNNRTFAALEVMAVITQGLLGKRLTYKDLVK